MPLGRFSRDPACPRVIDHPRDVGFSWGRHKCSAGTWCTSTPQFDERISSSIPSAAIRRNFRGSIPSSPVAGQPEEQAPQVRQRFKLPPSGSSALTWSMKVDRFFPPRPNHSFIHGGSSFNWVADYLGSTKPLLSRRMPPTLTVVTLLEILLRSDGYGSIVRIVTDADEISLRLTLTRRLAPFHSHPVRWFGNNANNAFRRSRSAFIDAKMNARSLPDVVADFRANAVRAVVDHAASKIWSRLKTERVNGRQCACLDSLRLSSSGGHNPQAIGSTIGKIHSDHGASPRFKKRQGSPFECS